MSFSLSKWHLFNVEMTSSPIHVFFSSLTKIIFLCIFSFKKANFTFLSPHNMCSTKKCHPVLFHTFVLFFLIASLYQVDFWLVSQLNRSRFTGYFQFMYPWVFLFFRHTALSLVHCFLAFMVKKLIIGLQQTHWRGSEFVQYFVKFTLLFLMLTLPKSPPMKELILE